MKKEMQIILEVNHHAEYFYEEAIQLGDHAAYALKAKHRSQMTGLETLAESSLKVSDVLDYIKRQTARFSYWRETFPHPENPSKQIFGERLKEFVDDDLKKRRDMICSKEQLDIGEQTDKDQRLRRRIYMLLIRQFLRQMIVQYEYRVSFEKTGKEAQN
jgi:hypothetical protein